MQLAVIEGFYGRSWEADAREQIFPHLSRLGYQSYVYAPKAESKLRREWSEPFSDLQLEHLAQQGKAAKQSNLHWGVGLSPLGLDQLDLGSRQKLDDKVSQIAQLEPDLFCLLFDDMRGDQGKLAHEQLAIVDRILHHFGTSVELTVCPTYYSTDPILEKLFGARPKNYWAELGAGLDHSVNLFWTGEKVCSAEYSKLNIEFISDAFRRAPSLWDNYPVNDSKRLSKHLLLKPFSHREPWLSQYLTAHFVNPMNQAWLSLLPLSTLATVYGVNQAFGEGLSIEERQLIVWRDTLLHLAGEAAPLILENLDAFHDQGVESFSESHREALSRQFRDMKSPMAKEVSDWLNGLYAFDETCLTD